MNHYFEDGEQFGELYLGMLNSSDYDVNCILY